MAMEAHNLRFVRCPKCSQLLVEYPTIPVYKCGGCGAILRAKHLAVPVAQAGSESEDYNSFPSSLKGSPHNSKSISSDEQKSISTSDHPHEAMADGSISSTTNNNYCEAPVQERTRPVADSVGHVEHPNEDSVGHVEHPNEETSSLIDGNIKKYGVTAKEIHDEDIGPDSSSKLTEKVENVVTSENANGEVNNVATSELSTTLKAEAVHRGERLHTYEGMHAESHKALIEELERSLSFSSDDEYFSDEAENSSLSDALRNQMGSRRFMPGGKMNDASRSDPHGRLIEELEMSFSDVEEPMEQHALVTRRVHGNAHDKDPQNLDDDSAHSCEETLSSFEHGCLKSEQTSHQENWLIGNGNQGKEYIEDDNNATSYIHRSEHIVIADEEIAERSHKKEHDKDWQSADTESAYPCKGGTSSVDDGSIKVLDGFQSNDLATEVTEESVEGCMEDDKTTNCVHGNDNLVLADEDIAERTHGTEELTADGTQEMEEGCMEDDNMTNCVHGNDNLVLAEEYITERVHGNEETADGTGENELSRIKNENENVAVADEDIAKKVHENEHGNDGQSPETESAHLYEGVISSFSANHVKSEQSFQQDEPIADGTKQKEGDYMEDGDTTSCVQENSAAVARFSSMPNMKTQCKLASFDKNKEQMTYTYRGSQLRQRRSLDSEDFDSVQNFMELQMDGTSTSLLSGSPSHGDLMHRTSNKFNNIVRHERLKKMDELRDQLTRLSSQKGSERSYQKRGLEYQQQPNSYDVEQHLQSVDGDSIPSSCALESYYGYGRPPRYQLPNPLSPIRTNALCHFGHAQSCLPHNYDPWEFNSYYQSSYAESTIIDHESLRSSYKEQKRVVRKHILRPLSGASPFTICNSCFSLVQMPSDIYISKAKVGKMQCGKCSKVLSLSFPALCNADAMISMDVAQESYSLDDSIVAKNEDIASYYAECLTGAPVSISEDYGASYTRSLPTQAGSSSLAAMQSGKKVSDSALHRLMGYDSASQLLRHSTVFEDGYESFESMVPISSRVSRRKNM